MNAGLHSRVAEVVCRDVVVDLDGARVLDGVTLSVDRGEWLTVIGPNGAGKSTLLRALTGLVPARGEISLGGSSAAKLSRRVRARLVALVPQAPLVPPGVTVADYVLLGRTPHIPALGRTSVADVAVVAGAMESLDMLPFAARILSSLSGGERQRAFLARALAQEAAILLLDEPTTALDIGHQQHVLHMIQQLRGERDLTVICTMHDLTLAGQYADTLALLDHGHVVAVGPAREVLTEGNLDRYYGARVRVVHEGGHVFVMPLRAGERVSL